jgi:hypothetical protein
VPLPAYLPLEAVYAFHEAAETWIWRRYVQQVDEAAGAERTRAAWTENPISIFRDRSTKGDRQTDAGQRTSSTCVVYTRTKLVTTDDRPSDPTSADVLFNPADLSAWQATSSGDWDEARGYAVTLTWAGVRGRQPWV